MPFAYGKHFEPNRNPGSEKTGLTTLFGSRCMHRAPIEKTWYQKDLMADAGGPRANASVGPVAARKWAAASARTLRRRLRRERAGYAGRQHSDNQQLPEKTEKRKQEYIVVPIYIPAWYSVGHDTYYDYTNVNNAIGMIHDNICTQHAGADLSHCARATQETSDLASSEHPLTAAADVTYANDGMGVSMICSPRVTPWHSDLPSHSNRLPAPVIDADGVINSIGSRVQSPAFCKEAMASPTEPRVEDSSPVAEPVAEDIQRPTFEHTQSVLMFAHLNNAQLLLELKERSLDQIVEAEDSHALQHDMDLLHLQLQLVLARLDEMVQD